MQFVYRYAVGAKHNGVLYLTPLKTIVQMRPGVNYWDTADATAETARARAAAEKASNSGEFSADEDEARPLLAKFARNESDEAKTRREASYAFLKRSQDDEPWVSLRHHAIDNRQATDERRLLYGVGEATRSSDSTEFCETSQEYLEKLVARSDAVDKVTASTTAATGAHTSKAPTASQSAPFGLSLKDIHRMPTTDQIRTILVNVKVINFAKLMSLISRGATEANVLLIVEQEAHLVQGCWVVKSSRLYPEKTVSGFDGKVPSENLCRARNYILWRFTMSHYLTRSHVSDVLVNVPLQDQQIMMEQLGVQCGQYGWRFSHEFDRGFVTDYPQVNGLKLDIYFKNVFLYVQL